jgi:hypothetical protein
MLGITVDSEKRWPIEYRSGMPAWRYLPGWSRIIFAESIAV